MGYLTTAAVDVVALPSNPAYSVSLKRKASYGDQLAMQEALIKINPADMAQLAQQPTNGNGNGHTPEVSTMSKVEVTASVRALTLALIVSWTLTDEQDQPLAVTAENLDRLEPEDGQFLAEEARKRLPLKRSEESRRPFGKPSGSRSQPHRANVSPRPGG